MTFCDKIKAGRAIINIQNRVDAERALLAAVVAERQANAVLDLARDQPGGAWSSSYETWREAREAAGKAADAYMATLATEPAEPLAYSILKPGALDSIAEPGQF